VNQIAIEVSNPSDIKHDRTTVEIPWNDISAKLPSVKPTEIMVVSVKSGEEIPSQAVYHGQEKPQMLIFQVSLAAKESADFLIKEGKPKPYAAKTYGRYVPERKDDFAWENDRVVFRMYGPALAKENPSNGVDMWLKRTDKMIVDQFYNDDLKNKKSYHVDHGEGLDCYKVGHELGAGGVSPYVNGKLWVGNHYATQQVLDNGPLRTTFKLTYNNLPVEDKTFSEELIISIDAGSQLNKAEVTFTGDFSEIQVAGGISLHKEIGNMQSSVEKGYIAYGETATSDAGVPAGRNYVGVLIPKGMTESIQESGHLLALAPYKKGDSFTYYFGGGWSKWGFESDDAWFNYMEQFSIRLKNPLKVTIK
jgi:hypothetical protein